MKKSLLAVGLAAALFAPQVAGAEGFGIVEWSAEGIAMGGARMFAEGDAANIAYNPASITKIDGKALKFSATYISPHGRYDVMNEAGDVLESGRNRVRPGWAPAGYYVRQIDEKNWIGIGNFPRFAMASEFEAGSLPARNNKLAKLNGMSFTPVYAHKFDKKWSASVGAEINYVGLELQKDLLGMSTLQVEGESWAMGWNAAANYAFDDKNEIGVVYRSKITHSLEADTVNLNGHDYTDAYGVVTLPDTWSIGYNHKFDKNTRVELNATRTNWHTYDALDITFDKSLWPGVLPNTIPSPKNWEDGWRYAIGIEHKLSDKYSLMGGLAYDEASIPYYGGDFIVPTGDRRTYSLGVQYHDKDQTVALAAAYMDVGDLNFAGNMSSDGYNSAHTHDNYVKIYSISYQRNF